MLLEAFKARKLILEVKVECFDAQSVPLSVFVWLDCKKTTFSHESVKGFSKTSHCL